MSDASRDHALRAFRRSHRDWPSFVSDSAPNAEKEWFALSVEDQKAAASGLETYVAACTHLKLKICSFAIYLREKRWEKVEAVEHHPDVRRRDYVSAPPFGPLFGAVRAWLCLQGPIAVDLPDDLRRAAIENYERLQGTVTGGRRYLHRKGIELAADGSLIFPPDFEQSDRQRRIADTGYPSVNAMHEQAAKAAPADVPARLEALAELCEPVPVHGDVFAAWLAHDEREGWPRLPDPGHMNVVWFPKGGPSGLAAFEVVARALMDRAEVRGDEHAV